MALNIHKITGDYFDFLHDESRLEGSAEWICFPKNTGEVQEAVLSAREKGGAITVQGGRTGITGGCVPTGGLIVNLSRMDKVGEISGDTLCVQPGATLAEIRDAVGQNTALFFPSDLTETTATIGGMAANNASGARSFKYGSVRRWIHALEIVFSNGEIARLERGIHKADGPDFEIGGIKGRLPEIKIPAVKSAAGYFSEPGMDLVDLFIGAEGTLGIITGITLRLLPKPGTMIGLTSFWPNENTALEFVRFLRMKSAPVAIEFFDTNALGLLRKMKGENAAFSDLPELNPEFHTAVYFEFEGNVPDAVIDAVEKAVECWYSEGEREIAALKNFRHAIPEAVNLLIGERKKSIPGLTKLGTDMAVPDDHLTAVMQMYREGLESAGLESVIFGHIGNNHVHVNILPRNLSEFEAGKSLYLEWAEKVVKLGGSVSAEHGIGKNKREFLRLMFGDDGIAEMRRIRKLFDPTGLLNPGNLFL